MDTDKKFLFDRLGLKNTKQRHRVYDALSHANLPLTAEALFIMIKEADPTISLSTVYRILEIFVAKGLVIKSSASDEGKSVFEIDHHEHRHHLVCTGCKKRMAVENCPLDDYERSLEKQTQFQITAHKLEIYGLCPLCQEKSN